MFIVIEAELSHIVLTLFRNFLSRAAERHGEILELRQAIIDLQNSLAAMDVHIGLERQCRQNGRVDIGEALAGVVGHDVTTALCAELPMTSLGLLMGSQV